MTKLILILSLTLLCSACNDKTNQLTSAEKSRLKSEQINDSKECVSFKSDLQKALKENLAVDKIYDEAIKAHCINRDI